MSAPESHSTAPWWRDFRPTVGSTVAAIVGVALLLGLGSWQVYRLGWKQDLIAERTAQLDAVPVALPTTGAAAAGLMWHPVEVTGRFVHDEELHLGARSQRGNVGFHVLTPLVRDDGPAVLVNRGWVPTDNKAAETRALGQVDGVVTVRGIATPGAGSNAFTPDNDPARNFWFYVDYPEMAAAVERDLLPVVVDADTTANPGGFPIGGQTRLDIPNDHLQYAITWYLLALTLVVVYVAWNVKRRREQSGGTNPPAADRE